jgi:adenylate cyclase
MQKPCILCVDDEVTLLESLREQMKRVFSAEYNVEIAESAEMGMEIIEEFIEDGIEVPLIISDQIMPGMKGDEFLIKIHQSLPTTLKILLTGQANAEAVGNIVNKAKLYRYIAKPWDTQDLILTVTQAVKSFYNESELNKKSMQLFQNSEIFYKYVPVEFLKLLNYDESNYNTIKLGDSIEKEMSIMFSDIRSFTTLSETMTPKENFDFINAYLSYCGPAIRKYNGFIDKYIGDAIMALFPNKPEDAIDSAIQMLDNLYTYNQKRKAKGRLRISSGIGIHTGNIMLGVIGEEKRFNCTVISDAVNMASRVESLTKQYSASILISESTYELIDKEKYFIRIVDYVAVKGKAKGSRIYEILNGNSQRIIDLKLSTKGKLEEAILLYKEKEFTKSLKIFREILEIDPKDSAVEIYEKRATHFEKFGVPPDWEGIEKLDLK